MTPRQADQIIKAGKPVTVHNAHFGTTWTATFVSRDGWNIISADGGKFDRGDLKILDGTDLQVYQEYYELGDETENPEGGW